MYIVSNVRVCIKEKNIKEVIARKLKISCDDIISFKYYKKAIDSRNKNDIFFLCHFLVSFKSSVIARIRKNKNVKKYEKYKFEINKCENKEVIVVGCGPSGLFASYVLALAGVKVRLIEQGKKVEDRIEDVKMFFDKGILNEKSNLSYGEGGAGTFSDGKLTTNINDKRIEFIKETFIKFGANENIYYESKPHIGSDILIEVLKNFRKELIRLGVIIEFNTKLIDVICDDDNVKSIKVIKEGKEIIYNTTNLVLATGHSARDIYYLLNNLNVNLERKPFSIGVRIEHKQIDINKSQYGDFYKDLNAADYKVVAHLDNNRSLYSFCMCPGGMVVASNNDKESIVTNGMSYFKRDLENSNSALLVNVLDSDLEDDLFAGIRFQEKYEKLAFSLSNSYKAPCQLFKDLKDNVKSIGYKSIKPSYPLGVTYTNLRECLPTFLIESLVKGIPLIGEKIKGFDCDDAILIAPETRSSSPIRIIRDESYQTNIKGIYPCGEGSGYSSGITTSCLDGIRVALKIIENK